MTTRDIQRQEIVQAAIELFAAKGFRGTTTRDLAAKAGINEAIIFRHFTNKTELYRAILEEKVHQTHDAQYKEVGEVARTSDVRTFLEFLGNRFLERHEQDSTFMRLLLFSALEGHELVGMFLESIATSDPLAAYMDRLIKEGTFRPMNPYLAARAFLGMFVCHIQMQEIFGQKNKQPFDRQEAVQMFVSIFLEGMKAGSVQSGGAKQI
jgi:AcrR family transcriptional regulator